MIPILPACGIHHGVSFEDYSRWPAANFSTIKHILSTPSKCKFEMDHPGEQTPAQAIGQALHVATLEPARFDAMFHICPPCDRRTAEGKALYAEESRKAEGKIMLRQGSKDDEAMFGQVESVRGMAKAIRNLKSAAPFISGQGRNEVCLLWKDAETELFCKARLDRFIESGFAWPVIVELKSTQDASIEREPDGKPAKFQHRGFPKHVDNMHYDAQAACYSTGIFAITGRRPLHLFIAVENFPPFDAPGPYFLDDASLQAGMTKYRAMLRRYAECVKTNHWPGYPDERSEISLPQYALEREYAK